MRTLPSLIFLPCLALSAPEVAPSLPYQAGQGFNPGAGGQGHNPGQGREQAPVAFTAQRATPYSRTGPGQLRFERSVTNLGGGWAGSSSQFSAPASGTYHFTWAALSPARQHLKLVLMRNGVEQAASWAGREGYQTASGAATLTLRRGDQVYLYVEEGEVYEPSSSTGYAMLSGFRIG